MNAENKTTPYYNQPLEEILSRLGTDKESGLTKDEAERRLEADGANEFSKQKQKTLAAKFFEQFKSFMILVLLVAAVISGVVGFLEGEGFTDAIIILAIVVLNAIIGTAQEVKAEKSLEALEKMSAPFSNVIREGQVETIPSKEIVKGDIVILETGNLVPADLRLVDAVNLKIQEASLTGESVPEEKHANVIEGNEVPLGDRENMAYSSTLVSYGRGVGVVVATGMDTEVGNIAGMIQSVKDVKTPLQVKIDQLGKFLGIAALVICAIIFIVGIIEGRPAMAMFMTAVSLAAAAIPEGLPAVSTIVLAVGVQRLAKKNAIVRNLPSVETLGSTSVICSDKTGTLTQNKMTVTKLFTDGKSADAPESLEEDQKQLFIATILANDATASKDGDQWRTTGDPTETAFLDLGIKYGIYKKELEEEWERVAEIPFDSDRKMMATVNRHEGEGKMVVFVKGGLDEVLSRSVSILVNGQIEPLTEDHKEVLRKANTEMAESALRVLSAAYKDIDKLPDEITSENLEKDLVFIGMVGMIDPPREEVKDAVLKCRTAGIKPVMITGDHKITAVAIAEWLNVMQPGEIALTGTELEKMSDEELLNKVDSVSVYARVSPEHKVRIVKAFQGEGKVVAMTGDGVNDAPALKLADIGIAMGITGTDVAKEASDVVLADDNFATIVTAVEEGRRIYDNILKAIQFMLSTNIGEVLVIFIAITANWPAPLLPIQILWINLVTDSLPALALSVDPTEPDVMQRSPVDSKQGIMTKPFLIRIVLQGIMIAGLSLAAFLIGLKTSVEVGQTMTFAVLAFSQITHVLNVRSPRHTAFKGMFSNKLLLGALAIVILMMIAVIEIPQLHDIFHLAPLNQMQWLWIVALSLAPLPLVELVKAALRLFKK